MLADRAQLEARPQNRHYAAAPALCPSSVVKSRVTLRLPCEGVLSTPTGCKPYTCATGSARGTSLPSSGAGAGASAGGRAPLPAPGCAKPALRPRICKPVRQKLLPSLGPCGPRYDKSGAAGIADPQWHLRFFPHGALHMRPRAQDTETCALSHCPFTRSAEGALPHSQQACMCTPRWKQCFTGSRLSNATS